jgi:phospholipase C
MKISTLYLALAFCTIGLLLADCNGGSASSTPNPSLNPQSGSGSSPSPIEHVVIMIQENRTFNDFFATFPGADGTTTGRVVPNPQCTPPITSKETINLPEVPLVVPSDMNHTFKTGYSVAYDRGKMDAYDLIKYGGTGPPECTYPYQYTEPEQIMPYWYMAEQYALAEHMFTVQGSDSFTAHQDLIRGGTIVEPGKAMVDLPDCSGSRCYWGCDAPPGTITHLVTEKDEYIKDGPFPCTTHFKSTYLTLRDLLDAKYVSWKYYVPPTDTSYGKLMSAFDVIWSVRNGPEWKTNVITPETKIFDDISSGSLANVSWVVPDQNNSDHPGTATDNGPEWVASVVNAVGASSYWDSTAIIVVWDDWGGLYDNMGMLSKKLYGYGGLGPRVPAIIISPYAKAGYISQTMYTFGSILKYIEQNWNLGSLGTSDETSNSIIDCFNYSQPPIQFTPIPSSLGKSYFMHEKPSFKPVDTDM